MLGGERAGELRLGRAQERPETVTNRGSPWARSPGKLDEEDLRAVVRGSWRRGRIRPATSMPRAFGVGGEVRRAASGKTIPVTSTWRLGIDFAAKISSSVMERGSGVLRRESMAVVALDPGRRREERIRITLARDEVEDADRGAGDDSTTSRMREGFREIATVWKGFPSGRGDRKRHLDVEQLGDAGRVGRRGRQADEDAGDQRGDPSPQTHGSSPTR